jgi:hypothetical protein
MKVCSEEDFAISSKRNLPENKMENISTYLEVSNNIKEEKNVEIVKEIKSMMKSKDKVFIYLHFRKRKNTN